MDDLARRVAELEQENARLKRDLLEVQRTKSEGGAPKTIIGLAVMVLMLDANRRATYGNAAFLRFAGLSREQVIGRSLEEIDHSRLGKGFLSLLLEQALREGGTHTVETGISDPDDGRFKYIKATVTVNQREIQFMLEDVSRSKMLEASFKRYVSPKIIDELVKNDFDMMRAQRYEMSVLFSDLRGFTSMCTRIEPERVKRLIDRWLSVMMQVIIDCDATIDKVVGDEVMALFGAPIYYPDHAVRAIDVAIKMQRAHKAVMTEWIGELAPYGLTPPPMGIGINSGEMIVGNIGSEQRLSYTVLGHNVNLAARLCSAAHGDEILISRRTFDLARLILEKDASRLDTTVKFRRGEAIHAKGIPDPVETILVCPAR